MNGMALRRCPRCGFGDALLVPEVAIQLGITEQFVRALLGRGVFPGAEKESVPGGHRWWVPRAEVTAYRRSRARKRRAA